MLDGLLFLVRQAFELVAKNSYGDLYKKVVGRMDRNVKWEAYVGSIKDIFSEMTNNCLYYNVSEEKGVVLNGPPGSGKTFLVGPWLSVSQDGHDIATSDSALQDPSNPIDGAVDNLEKVYDIAKMIAPTVVFFDEGDALAPKRSSTGGNPSDKLTNKFLNLIDGETPLHKVFTVLTTNRLDILDPALIRSKRLKVLEIKGLLNKDDIVKIVEIALEGIAGTDHDHAQGEHGHDQARCGLRPAVSQQLEAGGRRRRLETVEHFQQSCALVVDLIAFLGVVLRHVLQQFAKGRLLTEAGVRQSGIVAGHYGYTGV